MSPTTVELLRDILREAEFLQTHSTRLSREAFLADPVLQRAFVRSLEIIGEAAKKVPADPQRSLSDLEWRKMAGMRDRLIHDYGEVDYSSSGMLRSTKPPSWSASTAPSSPPLLPRR